MLEELAKSEGESQGKELENLPAEIERPELRQKIETMILESEEKKVLLQTSHT